MLVYDEQLPVLDDSFEGDEVALLAVANGVVDKAFRRNYAWAKYAADRGQLKKIIVVVRVGKESHQHMIVSVVSALSGGKLHPAAWFQVEAATPQISADKVAKAAAYLAFLEPETRPVVQAKRAVTTVKEVKDVKDGKGSE